MSLAGIVGQWETNMEFAKQLGGIQGYAQAGQTVAVDEREGEISRLERSVKGLYELRARLAGVNNSLRGPRPESGNKTEAPISTSSLASLVKQVESIVESCHCELNETNEILR